MGGVSERAIALVISESPAFADTIEILLAERFAVRSAGPAEATDLEVSPAVLVVDSTCGIRDLPSGSAPVLCIGSPPRAWRSALSRRRHRVLGAEFDPYAVHDAVAALTGAPAYPAPQPDLALAYPYAPQTAVEALRRATGSWLPVVLSGEPGTGKLRLARAIHASSGAAGLVTATAAELNRAVVPLLPSLAEVNQEATAIVLEIGELDSTGQRFLRDWLEQEEVADAAGQRHRLRVIALSRTRAEELLRCGTLPKDLYYRLNVLAVHLPPLRERVADIPALVAAISQRLCAALALQPVTFTEASLTRLSRYLWFGNLAELEAVLARTIAFTPKSTIDRDDLLFGYGSVRPRLTAAVAAGAAANGATVDLIINELAHEFKNPMVTIKTFAQHLDHLSADGDGAAQVARLTGEAIERMDGALENLIQFTRFHEPARHSTPLDLVVSHALHAVDEQLAEKQIAIEIEPAGGSVLVDAAQVSYALGNLLRSIIRDLSPGDRLALRAPGGGVVAIEYPSSAHSAARQLAAMVAAPSAGERALPLGFAFAKSLVERNGGRFRVVEGSEPAAVTIALPLAGEQLEHHGEREDTHR